MSKRIRVSDPAGRLVRDTSTPLLEVPPSVVESAFEAEAVDQKLHEALAPITLFAVRSELLGRLQSSGGRPALSGTSRRAKIPLGDSEWADLEQLASLVSEPGLSPTAGQIASVLLSLSVRSVVSQVERSSKEGSSAIGRELAALSANIRVEPGG